MEDTKLSTVPNIMQDSKVQENEKSSKTLVIVLLLVIFLQFGLLAYLFLTERIVLNESEIEQESTSLEESEDIYEKDTIKEEKPTLLTYTFDNSKMATGYTFKYPDNWEITKEDTTCGLDPVSNTEICTNHRLILSNIDNPSYNITLEMCSECSPGAMCLFPDSDFDKEYIDSMQGGVTFKEYEDFYDGGFRRASEEVGESEELTICKLEESGNSQDYYHSSIVNGMSTVIYGIEKNPDENILEIMDSIVISMENI